MQEPKNNTQGYSTEGSNSQSQKGESRREQSQKEKERGDYLPEHIRNWFSSLDVLAVLHCVLVKKRVGYYYVKTRVCGNCGVKIECYNQNKEQIEKRAKILTKMRQHDFTKDDWGIVSQKWVSLTQEHARKVKKLLTIAINKLDLLEQKPERDTMLVYRGEQEELTTILNSIVSQLQEDH